MKKILLLGMTAVMLLLSLQGCYIYPGGWHDHHGGGGPWHDEGGGYGHDGGSGHGGHDSGGGRHH